MTSHAVETAFELGWARLENGELLAAAEKEFDALVSTDKNLRHQQNLTGRRLAILVLPTTSWPRLEQHVDRIVSAIEALTPGEYVELQLKRG